MGNITVNAIVNSSGRQVSAAAEALQQSIWDAHTGADLYFTGYTSETPDTTTVCTTPDAVRTAIETWRANPNQLLKCVCQWNGILDLTSASFRGPASGSLTADAGEFGGYIRPSGGVWIVADGGYSPVFGNADIAVYGMPRIHIEGIGFAGMVSGGSTSSENLNFYTTASFPMPAAVVVKNCTFGLTIHRPAEAAAEYTRSIGASEQYSIHIEGNVFAGTRLQILSTSKYTRVINNHAYNNLADFVALRGYTSSMFSGHRAYAIVQGNLRHDSVDNASFSGLHTDFVQYGSAGEVHDGYDLLCLENMCFAQNTLAYDSQTQGVYGDDATTIENNVVLLNNLMVFGAYHGLTVHDPSGQGDFYFERNTLARTGDWYSRTNAPLQDTYPQILINGYGGTPASAGGVIRLSRNIIAQISNTPSATYTEDYDIYVTPIANQVTGDGFSLANAYRYEDFFTATGATLTRDGSDWLTYSLQAGDTNKATAFYRIADFFQPKKGWAYAGCSDPETWTYAPARP